MAGPSIACLGVIGKNNNPLHITIFPSHQPSLTVARGPIRTPLQFSLLLSSSLDIFESRSRSNATNGGVLSGDYGLLQALDERLAVYGFETNTGVKFVAVVDMRGRKITSDEATAEMAGKTKGKSAGGVSAGMVGLREGQMKPVFKAVQLAYVHLLRNPFYEPDEHSPATGRGGKKIASPRFAADMQTIGEVWVPGMTEIIL